MKAMPKCLVCGCRIKEEVKDTHLWIAGGGHFCSAFCAIGYAGKSAQEYEWCKKPKHGWYQLVNCPKCME